MSIICYNCGCTLGTLDQFCTTCDADIEEKAQTAMAFAEQMIAKPCPECHYGAPPAASQCRACGYDFAHSEPRPLIYAPWPMRLGAAAIDLVLVGLPVLAMAVVVGQPAVVVWFAAMFPLLYCLGFWTLDGATPGKAAFGLRVVTSTGEPVFPIQGFIRYTGYLVSTILFFIGHLMALGNRERRGFHDFWAGTVVVKSQRRS
ncbi:MAG TPA: RDD family protein [Dehalococcoidia bacterium]